MTPRSRQNKLDLYLIHSDLYPFSVITDFYFKNPRYFITLVKPDEHDPANLGECTCIISLMLKHFRKRKYAPKRKRLIIGFDVHQVGNYSSKAVFTPSVSAALASIRVLMLGRTTLIHACTIDPKNQQ